MGACKTRLIEIHVMIRLLNAACLEVMLVPKFDSRASFREREKVRIVKSVVLSNLQVVWLQILGYWFNIGVGSLRATLSVDNTVLVPTCLPGKSKTITPAKSNPSESR